MKLLPPPGPQRRRTFALLGLLVVALAIYLWRSSAGPAAQTAQTSNTRAAVQVPVMTPATMPQPLALDKLEPVPEEPAKGRNLFRFGERPAPPPPPRPVGPPPTPPPPPKPVDMGPPPITLVLTGLVTGGDGRPVAQLKDPKTGALFMGNEGMILDGQYKILKIGVTTVIVAYVDGKGQRTIPLGG
jgi:hypothetical protein